MKSHEVPKAMYFNQSGSDAFEGTLRTWDQVMDQEDNDVIDELQAADQIINFARRRSGIWAKNKIRSTTLLKFSIFLQKQDNDLVASTHNHNILYINKIILILN